MAEYYVRNEITQDEYRLDYIDPDDPPLHKSMEDRLREIFPRLNKQLQKVVTMRFGLDDGQRRSLEEVAQELGLTRERVRRMESIAIRRLSHCPTRRKKLKDYLDD
ncbi:MAG: hypothetical protein IJL87_05415 [Clostridia bacterium]|nr:hypothetical protein [Clostridia bacterium]